MTINSESTSLCYAWPSSPYYQPPEAEQKNLSEKKVTIQNFDDLKKAFAQIPREITYSGERKNTKFINARDVCFYSSSKIIFPDQKKEFLLGPRLEFSASKGNSLLTFDSRFFFNADKKIERFIPGSKTALRSEFELVSIEPFNQLYSLFFLNLKITIWDLSSSKLQQKESWDLDLEKELNLDRESIEFGARQAMLNPSKGDLNYFNISEDGSWILITHRQKESRILNFYSITEKKIVKKFTFTQNENWPHKDYLLAEGYLAVHPTTCFFIPLKEGYQAWKFQGKDLKILNYNSQWVVLKNNGRAQIIHLKTSACQKLSFPIRSEETRLYDNFLVTFGDRNPEIFYNEKNCNIWDITTGQKYNVVPHFSKLETNFLVPVEDFLDVLIKANKIYFAITTKNKKEQIVQFELHSPESTIIPYENALAKIKSAILVNLYEEVFKYLGPVDLNNTIQVSQEWKTLSRITALARLQLLLQIPTQVLTFQAERTYLSFRHSETPPSIRNYNHVFVPASASVNLTEAQKKERKEIAYLWTKISEGKKYAFFSTDNPKMIGVLDMDVDSAPQYIVESNDVVTCLPIDRESCVVLTTNGSLSKWARIGEPGIEFYYKLDQLKLRTYESIKAGFFSSEQNQYIIVTTFNGKSYIQTFSLYNGNISSLSRYETLIKPEFHKVFYQNGLLSFTWLKLPATLELAAFAIESDKIKIVWSKEIADTRNEADPSQTECPTIVAKSEDYLAIHADDDANDLNSLKVLETKTGREVLTVNFTDKCEAFICDDLLGIYCNEHINIYHLTTAEFIATFYTNDIVVKDIKFLSETPKGACLRFIGTQGLDGDFCEIKVGDIYLEYPQQSDLALVPPKSSKDIKASLKVDDLNWQITGKLITEEDLSGEINSSKSEKDEEEKKYEVESSPGESSSITETNSNNQPNDLVRFTNSAPILNTEALQRETDRLVQKEVNQAMLRVMSDERIGELNQRVSNVFHEAQFRETLPPLSNPQRSISSWVWTWISSSFTSLINKIYNFFMRFSHF